MAEDMPVPASNSHDKNPTESTERDNRSSMVVVASVAAPALSQTIHVRAVMRVPAMNTNERRQHRRSIQGGGGHQ